MTLNEFREQICLQGDIKYTFYNYKTDTYIIAKEEQCIDKKIHYIYPCGGKIVIEFDYEEEE